MLMSGRIIPTIFGKGWRTTGFVPPPTSWSFDIALELLWHLWLCPFIADWGLRSSLVCHLGPNSVQHLSRVWLFVTPWPAARQASLSITNSWSLLKLMSIELVMSSNHLILWSPLLLPLSIFPSISFFSKEFVLCTRWPKYWSFSFNISPFNEYSGL